MALDDLDLEFEDEDEAKKKKNDALQQDVDLEFHMQDSGVKPRPTRPGAPAAPAGAAAPRPAAPQAPSAGAQVRPIQSAQSARPATASARPQTPAAQAPVNGSSALKVQPSGENHYDLESEEIVRLREQARKAEFDANVKVEVAEFKTELLSELLSDMKLMDHQVNQLLVRINAKHPDMKQEVLMIKKLLADFTAKKRK